MRTGYFGTFNESDELEEILRAIRKTHQNLEDTARPVISGYEEKTPQYLCIAKISGRNPSSREQFLGVENDDRAILKGIEWAKSLVKGSHAMEQIAEIRITGFVMRGKDDTLAGWRCFDWKYGGPTSLEEEIDRTVAAMLFSKLNEVEMLLRPFDDP